MGNLVNCEMFYLLCASMLFINIEAGAGKLLYVFGDSLFDPGNLKYYTPTKFIPSYHPPYGQALYTATGRFSDGLLVPDFIAKYGDMPLIEAALDPTTNGIYGYNFACAGAGVYYNVDAMNLGQQLSLYKNLTAAKEGMLEDAVYLLSIGGDDYIYFFVENKNVSEAEMQYFVDYIIQGMKQVIQEIYKTGGRKFVIQDVGPLGCMPMSKYRMSVTKGCYEDLNTIARLHNDELKYMFQNLTNTEEYQDIKYGVFDYYHQLLDRITNTTTYGFLESEMACCGYGGKFNGEICGSTSVYFTCSNPSAFVFFDSLHTTQAVNSQLVELMWVGDQTMISPYNVRQLFNLTNEVQGRQRDMSLAYDHRYLYNVVHPLVEFK